MSAFKKSKREHQSENKKHHGPKQKKIDLRLTDKEEQLLNELSSWSKRSHETTWILGQPI